MIPLRDVIPSRTVPVVTITIIVINALAFLYELSLPDRALRAFLQEWGVVPALFNWPSVITSMFLHGGWMHILGNMLYLWIFGDNVEDRVGHVRFIFFYLLCGTAGALAQVATTPNSYMPTIGASGAIAGVMGAYFILYPQSRVLTLVTLVIFWDLVEVPAIFFLGIWFLMQLFSGVGSIALTIGSETGGVAFWAHVAGFLTGLGGVFLFRKPQPQPTGWWDDR